MSGMSPMGGGGLARTVSYARAMPFVRDSLYVGLQTVAPMLISIAGGDNAESVPAKSPGGSLQTGQGTDRPSGYTVFDGAAGASTHPLAAGGQTSMGSRRYCDMSGRLSRAVTNSGQGNAQMSGKNRSPSRITG